MSFSASPQRLNLDLTFVTRTWKTFGAPWYSVLMCSRVLLLVAPPPPGHPPRISELGAVLSKGAGIVSQNSSWYHYLSALRNRDSSSEWWVWSCSPGSWRVLRRGCPPNRGVRAGSSRVTSACLSLVPCFPATNLSFLMRYFRFYMMSL